MTLRDHDPMPFGKHRGTKMQDVPSSYLLWLDGEWENHPNTEEEALAVQAYINENRSVLEQEVENER